MTDAELLTKIKNGLGITGSFQDASVIMMHNGKKWVSVSDGNVWEPGVYGWSEIER